MAFSGSEPSGTVLHGAAQRGETSHVMRMIAAGHDVNAIDFYGRTPLDIARAYGQDAVAATLRRFGAL